MSAEMPASRRVFGLKADGAAIKVLLIDDEEMLRSTLRRLLGLDGFSVLDFGRGSDGVTALPSFCPDVIVTDVRMPDMDGSEVLTRVKSLSPGTAVILLTGHIDPDVSLYLKARGAFSVLVKPVSSALLERTIRAAAGEID